jgi:hypothetical protein
VEGQDAGAREGGDAAAAPEGAGGSRDEALAENDSPDYAHLADHEKMELFGPPQGL